MDKEVIHEPTSRMIIRVVIAMFVMLIWLEQDPYLRVRFIFPLPVLIGTHLVLLSGKFCSSSRITKQGTSQEGGTVPSKP